MSILTQKEIKYGFDYYHADELQPKTVIEVSEYNGEASLRINCTQLGDSFTPQYKTHKEKKRVLNDWCTFLAANPTLFTELSFFTRMPQELFNAVCMQTNLKKLYIKWGSYPDISLLSNLSSLKYLHIGSGSSVQSIEPIASLKKLVALAIENFQNIKDYSPLIKLERLESLSICGDGMAPKYIHINSLDFLTKLNQLRYFRLLTARLINKDVTSILSLTNLEHLSLMSNSKEVKALYADISKLPKLKYGLLVDNPEIYAM